MERRTASIATVTTSLPVVHPLTPTTTEDTKTRKKIPKKNLRKIQRRMLRRSPKRTTKKTQKGIISMEVEAFIHQRQVQAKSLEPTREKMKEQMSREKEMSRERLSLARFSENTTIIDVKVRFKSSYR